MTYTRKSDATWDIIDDSCKHKLHIPSMKNFLEYAALPVQYLFVLIELTFDLRLGLICR